MTILNLMVYRHSAFYSPAANTDRVVVRVRNRTLLVFPSYPYHSVDANASGETA